MHDDARARWDHNLPLGELCDMFYFCASALCVRWDILGYLSFSWTFFVRDEDFFVHDEAYMHAHDMI